MAPRAARAAPSRKRTRGGISDSDSSNLGVHAASSGSDNNGGDAPVAKPGPLKPAGVRTFGNLKSTPSVEIALDAGATTPAARKRSKKASGDIDSLASSSGGNAGANGGSVARGEEEDKKSAPVESMGDAKSGLEDAAAQTPAKKARKAKPVGPYTEYKTLGLPIPEPTLHRQPALPEGVGLKVVCWNVGGLRGILKSRPDALPDLVQQERPDVIGILEHKLQEDTKETKEALETLGKALPDYDVQVVNFSTAKKGYSGVAVLSRRDVASPALRIVRSESWDLPSAANEGRLVTVEYETLFVVFSYVPNSGEGLKRLDERIGRWDVELRAKLEELAEKKPVMLVGDLNVAHLDSDIWNVEAPHIPKSAGTTPQERESFSCLLNSGFVDAFRHMHPAALGAFTYWSVRAGNRPKNRGLRLDYVVVSKGMLVKDGCTGKPALVDAFHLPALAPGDHCPIGAIVSL